jgi:DNA-binding XRE family transcriptional regulator
MRNIKALREAQQITQQELAEAIGVTRQTVTAWEIGTQKPRLYLQQIKELCRVLNCDLVDIDVEQKGGANSG